jgi:hypothetical protein
VKLEQTCGYSSKQNGYEEVKDDDDGVDRKPGISELMYNEVSANETLLSTLL